MNPARKLLQVHREVGWSGLYRRSELHLLRHGHRFIDARIKNLQQSINMHPLAKDRPFLLRNASFRNRHQGQRCFIIGNGPSLKSQDLSPLAHELTFTMSGFWKHPVIEEWQPSYYLFADPLFFDGSEPMREFFADLRSRIHSTTFFIPLAGKEANEKMSLLPPEQTYLIAFLGRLEDGLQSMPDFTRAVPGVMSIAQLAIMAALYMGCSPIHLLGFDHDWLAHRDADQHFYQGATVKNHPVAQSNLNMYSYKHLMECQLSLWLGYEALSRFANQEGLSIVNATEGGFLDVFPRMEYSSIVSHK